MEKSRAKQINEYKKTHYKRVSLELKLDEYKSLEAAAEETGESVNGYIKRAIADRISEGKIA